jgi:hypothetical protein
MIAVRQGVYVKLNQDCRRKNCIQLEEYSFHQPVGLKLKEETSKCNIWSMPLDGAETGTHRKVDEKYLEILKCCAGEGRRR